MRWFDLDTGRRLMLRAARVRGHHARRDSPRRRIACLSQTEQAIFSLRVGTSGAAPLTLKQIGDSFGLSQERTRQISVRALRKLLQAGPQETP